MKREKNKQHENITEGKDSTPGVTVGVSTTPAEDIFLSPSPIATVKPTDTPTPTPSPTSTPTPIPTPSPMPTYTPTPTPTPTFQEGGATKYGDLSSYIGMTAGEVASKVGKTYQYSSWSKNMEDGTTGGMWFDKDVLFAFSDSGKTLDMSKRVYMIQIQSNAASGIAKNIGNGLNTTMNRDKLSNKIGGSFTAYYDAMNGQNAATAKYNGYLYSFSWNGNVSNAPNFITVSKIQQPTKAPTPTPTKAPTKAPTPTVKPTNEPDNNQNRPFWMTTKDYPNYFWATPRYDDVYEMAVEVRLTNLTDTSVDVLFEYKYDITANTVHSLGEDRRAIRTSLSKDGKGTITRSGGTFSFTLQKNGTMIASFTYNGNTYFTQARLQGYKE